MSRAVKEKVAADLAVLAPQLGYHRTNHHRLNHVHHALDHVGERLFYLTGVLFLLGALCWLWVDPTKPVSE